MKKIAVVAALILCVCLSASPASAQVGRFGLSLFGGAGISIQNEVLKGRDGDTGPESSSFDTTYTFGLELQYKLPLGLVFGIGTQYIPIMAKANRTVGGVEIDFAEFTAKPVYAFVRFQPHRTSGFSGHVEAGAGWNFLEVEKDRAIQVMESGLNETVSISATDGWIIFIGAGVDYFFSPSVSLGLGFRLWWGESDYTLSTANEGDIAKGSFNLDNAQVLLNLTFWFGK